MVLKIPILNLKILRSYYPTHKNDSNQWWIFHGVGSTWDHNLRWQNVRSYDATLSMMLLYKILTNQSVDSRTFSLPTLSEVGVFLYHLCVVSFLPLLCGLSLPPGCGFSPTSVWLFSTSSGGELATIFAPQWVWFAVSVQRVVLPFGGPGCWNSPKFTACEWIGTPYWFSGLFLPLWVSI